MMDAYTNNEKYAFLEGLDENVQKAYMRLFGDMPLSKSWIDSIKDTRSDLVEIPRRLAKDLDPKIIEWKRTMINILKGEQGIAHIPRDAAKQLEQELTRRFQGEGAGAIARAGAIGGLAGGTYGLLRHLPKYFEARKGIKKEEDKTAAEVPSVKKADMRSTIRNALSRLAQGEMPMETGQWPEKWWHVPMAGIPAGAAIGVPLAGAAAFMGADRLSDYMTDRARDKMLKERKRELQEEFKGLLTGSGVKRGTYISNALDAAADEYVKCAVVADEGAHGEPWQAALIALATLIGGGSFMAAKHLSSKKSPYAAQAQAVKDILKGKAAQRHPSLRLEIAATPEEALKPRPTGITGAQHALPIIIPEAPNTQEEDESYDLSKLSSSVIDKAGGIKDYITNLRGEAKRHWGNIKELRQQSLKTTPEQIQAGGKAFRGATDMYTKARDFLGNMKGGFDVGMDQLGRFLTGTAAGAGNLLSQLGKSAPIKTPDVVVPPTAQDTLLPDVKALIVQPDTTVVPPPDPGAARDVAQDMSQSIKATGERTKKAPIALKTKALDV